MINGLEIAIGFVMSYIACFTLGVVVGKYWEDRLNKKRRGEMVSVRWREGSSKS